MAEKLWYSSINIYRVDHILSLSFSLSLFLFFYLPLPKTTSTFLKPEQLQFASIKTYSNKFWF